MNWFWFFNNSMNIYPLSKEIELMTEVVKKIKKNFPNTLSIMLKYIFYGLKCVPFYGFGPLSSDLGHCAHFSCFINFKTLFFL